MADEKQQITGTGNLTMRFVPQDVPTDAPPNDETEKGVVVP